MDRLADLGQDMMGTVLEGFDNETIEQMTADLGRAKENLREAISRRAAARAAA